MDGEFHTEDGEFPGERGEERTRPGWLLEALTVFLLVLVVTLLPLACSSTPAADNRSFESLDSNLLPVFDLEEPEPPSIPLVPVDGPGEQPHIARLESKAAATV